MTSTPTAAAVGDTAAPREFGPLTRQMFVRYSGASGDLNPMHYDDKMARSAGNPSVFSQGMHQSALLATFATDWLGAENVRRFGVRFREQVWPDDVLTCNGSVTAITEGAGGEVVATVELVCTRQTGAVAIAGSADFVVPKATT
ncbi:MaoC/PaaZ C-terminal domain-containing protein [Williamsia muralis]|uniref:MaoC/PaaZ C-terminal domain-containing protein n=1 Tax=Williamsia marianensis TaxID=85044 RepID=A0ABU4EYW0_WILMA|nr:MaoC/PaaZ C-terminal domain-containing protein [Williamsia muralis]MDV7136432.1 MaoC/PaaZ C-terminal domain-containing protein [Williamsia muralis]